MIDQQLKHARTHAHGTHCTAYSRAYGFQASGSIFTFPLMILPGIHNSLPTSMSKDQPEYMYSIRIVHSVLLPSAKPFKGQRSGTPTIVLHSSGHSIPFHSSPVHSTIPFHRSSPPNPYTRCNY